MLASFDTSAVARLRDNGADAADPADLIARSAPPP